MIILLRILSPNYVTRTSTNGSAVYWSRDTDRDYNNNNNLSPQSDLSTIYNLEDYIGFLDTNNRLSRWRQTTQWRVSISDPWLYFELGAGLTASCLPGRSSTLVLS